MSTLHASIQAKHLCSHRTKIYSERGSWWRSGEGRSWSLVVVHKWTVALPYEVDGTLRKSLDARNAEGWVEIEDGKDVKDEDEDEDEAVLVQKDDEVK